MNGRSSINIVFLFSLLKSESSVRIEVKFGVLKEFSDSEITSIQLNIWHITYKLKPSADRIVIYIYTHMHERARPSAL